MGKSTIVRVEEILDSQGRVLLECLPLVVFNTFNEILNQQAGDISNIVSLQGNVLNLKSVQDGILTDVSTLQTNQKADQSAIAGLQSFQSLSTQEITAIQNQLITIQGTQQTNVAAIASLQQTTINQGAAISSLQTSLNSLNTVTIAGLAANISNLQTQQTADSTAISGLLTQQSKDMANISTLQTNQAADQTNISTLQTEVAALTANQTNDEKNITALQATTAGNSTNIASLQTTVANINNTITTVESKQATDETNIAALQTEVATNTADIANLASGQAADKAAIAALQNTVNNTDATAIANMQAAITTLQTNQATDQSNIGILQNKEAADAAAITNLQTDLATTNTTLTNVQSTVSTISTKQTADEINIAANAAAISSLQATASRNSAAIATLQNTVNTIDAAAITTIQGDVATLQTNQAADQTNIANLQSSLASVSSAVTTIETKQATDESNIAALTTNLTTVTNKQATDESNISTLQTEVASLTSSAQAAASGIAALQTQQSVDMGNISTLQTGQANNSAAISSLQSSVAALASGQTADQAAIAALQTRATGDEQQISNLQSAMTVVQSNQATDQANIAALQASAGRTSVGMQLYDRYVPIPVLTGDLVVQASSQNNFVISNYTDGCIYSLSASSGVISQNGNIVSFTAPVATGTVTININSYSIKLLVVSGTGAAVLSGSTSVVESTSCSLQIAGYSSGTTYTVGAMYGTVVLNNGYITYRAPILSSDVPSTDTITVNGTAIPITVLQAPVPQLDGPLAISVYETTNYTIRNYIPGLTYSVSATSGTVSMSGKTVTYTAPGTVGQGGFTINGYTPDIKIVDTFISTPTIAAPINNAIGIGATPVISGSTFTSSDPAATQKAANWQLSTDPTFATVTQSSMNDTVNLTTWTVQQLTINTVYYVRVQYIDQNGNTSAWSGASQFTTATTFIPANLLYELISIDGTAGNQFGFSVAINAAGNVVAIASPLEATGLGSGSGSVYIFNKLNGVWVQSIELFNPNEASPGNFGYSVSMDSTGTIVAIGAPYSTITGFNNAGMTYVFVNTNGVWGQQAVVYASDFAANDFFGASVSLSQNGTVLAIGAFNKAVGGNNGQGAVYIFTQSGGVWTQIDKLLSSDGAANDYFGIAVDLNSDGTLLAVGASNKNIAGNNAQGAAYVFKNTSGTWAQLTELIATGGLANDQFGTDVAINGIGNTVVVGAANANVNGAGGQGAAYLFTGITASWTQVIKFVAPDGAGGDQFGSAVDIDLGADVVLIGAPNKNIAGINKQGKAYSYNYANNAWGYHNSFVSSALPANSFLGTSVNMSQSADIFVFGANGTTINRKAKQGAAFIA